MDKIKQPRVDKDAIIAGLQSQIEALRIELKTAEAARDRYRDTASENYDNGLAWRKTAEEARKELAGDRGLRSADLEALKRAEGQLRFAEGYIAALKGEPYQNREEVPF